MIVKAVGKCLIGLHSLDVKGKTGENIKEKGCSSPSRRSQRANDERNVM